MAGPTLSSIQPSVSCPKCGTNNSGTARFCVSCGTPLQNISTTTPNPPSAGVVSAASPTSPFYQFTASYYASEQAKAVDRTKTGLLVISIGFFVSWVPILGYIGGLFELVGALLVILGRKAFGPTHGRNVIWSIIISVVALGTAFAFGVAIVFAAISSGQYNGRGSPNLASYADLLAVGIIVATSIFGLAEVLFTYALQSENGRILLWCGYASTVAAAAVSYLLLSNLQYVMSLPQLAPALLFGIAYYMARTRIIRGEIRPQLQTTNNPPG